MWSRGAVKQDKLPSFYLVTCMSLHLPFCLFASAPHLSISLLPCLFDSFVASLLPSSSLCFEHLTLHCFIHSVRAYFLNYACRFDPQQTNGARAPPSVISPTYTPNFYYNALTRPEFELFLLFLWEACIQGLQALHQFE